MSRDDLAHLVGQVLDGRYRLDALLGQGGMGAVFRGWQVAMERRVAVKVLRPHLVGDPTAARRFAREAKGTFKVDSDHAIKVIDFAVGDGGLLYMVMEYLDGRTIGADVEIDGPMAPARAAHVARQMCLALAAAHRLGLVHRDIKPENVMLQVKAGDPDYATVLDFGLAKLVDGVGPGVFSRAALTQTDVVFGTPEYMAPEQAMGQPLDGRTDLYALGATLFEMLTGRPPFVEKTAMQILAKHVQATPPVPRELRPELAAHASAAAVAALEDVIARCLAKRLEGRPASAAALAAELEGIELALAPARRTKAPSTQDLPRLTETAPPPTQSMHAIAPAAAGPRFDVGASSAAPPVARRGRWIAGAALLATVGAAVGVVASRREEPAPTPASISTSVRMDAAMAPRALAIVDGGIAPPVRAAADAGARPVGHAAVVDDPRARAVAAHLAAAEAARRDGNHLRQLAEADAALRADGRSARARFLLGDALIATGDIANGCQYLRSVKRLDAARAAALAAGCPEH